jgi:hypothetical protein
VHGGKREEMKGEERVYEFAEKRRKNYMNKFI